MNEKDPIFTKGHLLQKEHKKLLQNCLKTDSKVVKNARKWNKITSLKLRVMPVRIALVLGWIFELLESVLRHFLDSFWAVLEHIRPPWRRDVVCF